MPGAGSDARNLTGFTGLANQEWQASIQIDVAADELS
jgi:hypothetical protein